MRILYVTTVGQTMGFFRSFVRELLDAGHVVDIATNENGGKTCVPKCYREWGCKVLHIPFSRSPLNISNIRAIKEIRSVVRSTDYNIVHCHTPVAAACTRLACQRFRKYGVKVIYTAHGFHFYTGAPLKNWVLFFPIEWICSWMTDLLITITEEDYARAKRYMHAKRTQYVPGVGIDTEPFVIKRDRKRIREELNIASDDVVILSVGELNANKNHRQVINALPLLDNNMHYIVAGEGDRMNELECLVKMLELETRVHLLGYRADVPELMKAADVYVLPSLREGLNVSLMEAMASGLPCVCRRIRGNVDLIDDGIGGILVCEENASVWAMAVERALALDRATVQEHNLQKVSGFSRKTVESILWTELELVVG